jgi:hypothetical protein
MMLFRLKKINIIKNIQAIKNYLTLLLHSGKQVNFKTFQLDQFKIKLYRSRLNITQST